MLIIFSGLSGVGKTTIARALATAIGAVHLRIDSIEQALRRCGVTVEAEGYVAAYAVAEDRVLGYRDTQVARRIARGRHPGTCVADVARGDRAGLPAVDQ